MQKIDECRGGDWVAIGHKDGHAGLINGFGERKRFCAAYEKFPGQSDAETNYLSGWISGNNDLWYETGLSDGKNALPVSQLEIHNSSAPKQQAPANHSAYETGWKIGNSEHWQEVGNRDGNDGLALAQMEAARADATAKKIRFDDATYISGWNTGNIAFWQNAGFLDAHNGIPETRLTVRVATAKGAGVLVHEDTYLKAWNEEIVNYWKNLGAMDAISGKDFSMRQVEAQQKGLKIFETEYRQNWNARLESYWRQVGNDDGLGHPFQLEARIASAAHDLVFVIARTREIYTQAWDLQNARYCNVDDAFAHGRHNENMAIEVCKSPLQGQLKRAYLSGHDYEDVSAKHARVLIEMGEYSRKIDDVRHKLERIDLEIRNQIENKQQVVNDETTREKERREKDRRVQSEQLEHSERQLGEARLWEDRYKQQMLKLKRDIYLECAGAGSI